MLRVVARRRRLLPNIGDARDPPKALFGGVFAGLCNVLIFVGKAGIDWNSVDSHYAGPCCAPPYMERRRQLENLMTKYHGVEIV